MFDRNKEYIIVSATALATSGALTILRQFIQQASGDGNNYIVFVPSNIELSEYENLVFVKTSPKSWIRRIYWDWFGCKRCIKLYSIKVKKVICLQNTTMNVPFPQIVYLHQPIPFSNFDSFLKDFTLSNLKLFLYKKFYAFFIFKFVDERTLFVVQTKWMKSSVLDKCQKLRNEQVLVLKPDINLNIEKNYNDKVSRRTILYPATALSYKNHLIILKALVHIRNKFGMGDIKFQVTFRKSQYKIFDDYVAKNNLSNNVEYLGMIPYSELQKKYYCASLIVFPSYIESYGLPLIEAAALGKQILCSDLPYARDVLENYEGAIFVRYNDEDDWARSIFYHLDNISHEKIKPYENNNLSSWPQFFKLI
ncbi:glycosyltransferase [Intestinirhabdus alba]|jgi:glycosyltransferase involved in cell wall biosynthesis|uniref:Glycosyltransferase n=1 Tax=Intestinirhabdus alba TaxID=2899544 RepID=A0A6L6IKI3_9ENTR|nr:glycosyltransferase [Intestinirhabdus alba]MTH47361.1 glycosyltransferase [Intestinirhabdus alba]